MLAFESNRWSSVAMLNIVTVPGPEGSSILGLLTIPNHSRMKDKRNIFFLFSSLSLQLTFVITIALLVVMLTITK